MKQEEVINNIYNNYIKLKEEDIDKAINYLCSSDDLASIIRSRLEKYKVKEVNELCFDFLYRLPNYLDKYDKSKCSLIIYFNTFLRYYILNSKNYFGGSKSQNLRILKNIVDNPLYYNLSEEEIINLFKKETNIKKDSTALEYLKLLNTSCESLDENIEAKECEEGSQILKQEFISLLKAGTSKVKGLTDREVLIFKSVIEGKSQSDLAREYNVSKQYINKVVKKGRNIAKTIITLDNVSDYIEK